MGRVTAMSPDEQEAVLFVLQCIYLGLSLAFGPILFFLLWAPRKVVKLVFNRLCWFLFGASIVVCYFFLCM